MENNNTNNNNLIITSPDISPETKSTLTKKIVILENQINSALLSPNSITNKKIDEIELLLNECDKIYRSMEVELSSYSIKTKEKYNLPFFKSKMNQLKGNFKEIENLSILKNENNENEDSNLMSNETRDYLINTNNEIDYGNRKMKDTIKLMNGVNERDKETMKSLKNQTNILINTGNLLNEAESYVKKAGKVLNTMIRRATTNKIILIGIIIMLGLINIMLIYYKIKYKITGK
jgi:hypothetical protein